MHLKNRKVQERDKIYLEPIKKMHVLAGGRSESHFGDWMNGSSLWGWGGHGGKASCE